MMKITTTALTLLIGLGTTIAAAQECDPDLYFPGSLPEHVPSQVAVHQVEGMINGLPSSDGIRVSVEHRQDDLWLDIEQFPGDLTIAASIRIVFMTARITKPDYQNLVLANEGQGIFALPVGDAFKIGCQFVWSAEGGQNPIALMRDFVNAVREYDTGDRIAPIFTGSLLGDTSMALEAINGRIYPEWALLTEIID